MISTAGDLINFCFRVSGINGQGQTSSAEDSADALTTLAGMIGQWQRKRWLIWSLTETIVVSTGQTSYTVGSTGNFPIARPDRIESAFVRLLPAVPGTFTSNGGVLLVTPGSGLPTSPAGLAAGGFWSNGGVVMVVAGTPTNVGSVAADISLGIIESQEDYNTIAIKTGFSSIPAGVFYESAFPTGVLHFWPVPSPNVYELHIFTKAALPKFAALTDAFLLPDEYMEAVKYNLVVRLAADWGMEPKPAHVKLAMAGLNTIRMANTQIPTQRMPGDLPGRGRRNGTNMAAFISGRW
jgi:hypothetical protein